MNEPRIIQPGSAAPEFDLLAHTGRRVTLDDFRGRHLVLFFMREFT